MIIDTFPKMCEYLKPVEGKEFKIVQHELTERELEILLIRDFINARMESYGQEPGIITQLRDKDETVMMADTEMERRTNKYFLWQANGDVLIGGLGLGMILLAAQEKEEVSSITVVELHQEIIDLVATQLPLNDKVNIICGDILEWYPPKGVLYDIIYFDIWNALCNDNYEEMKKLNRRFARRLNRENPNCGMSSWRYDEVKKRVYKSRRTKFSWGW